MRVPKFERPVTGFRFRPHTPTPCAGQPELFFSDNAEHAKAAALGCKHCPFLVECRLEGLERGEQGVWGGLSANQRSRMGAEGRTREMGRLKLELARREIA